jgi:hypothetical protein
MAVNPRNMSAAAILKIITLVVMLSAVLTACGIPSFNAPPGRPSFSNFGGSEIYLNFERTTEEATRGLILLYKFYDEDDAPNSFSSERSLITAYTNGNQAYLDMLNRGYTAVLNGKAGVEDIPTLAFADFETFFTDARLDVTGGFSSTSSDGIILKFNGIDGAFLDIVIGGTVSEPDRELLRDTAVDGETSFAIGSPLPANYREAHEDMPDTFVESGDALILVFAAFGYRSTFGEGQTYSLPAVMAVSDVFNVLVQ